MLCLNSVSPENNLQQQTILEYPENQFQNQTPNYESLNQHSETIEKSMPECNQMVEEVTDIKETDEVKGVFLHKIIRKEGRKNTNVPKFFVRIFIKYFKSYNPD